MQKEEQNSTSGKAECMRKGCKVCSRLERSPWKGQPGRAPTLPAKDETGEWAVDTWVRAEGTADELGHLRTPGAGEGSWQGLCWQPRESNHHRPSKPAVPAVPQEAGSLRAGPELWPGPSPNWPATGSSSQEPSLPSKRNPDTLIKTTERKEGRNHNKQRANQEPTGKNVYVCKETKRRSWQKSRDTGKEKPKQQWNQAPGCTEHSQGYGGPAEGKQEKVKGKVHPQQRWQCHVGIRANSAERKDTQH